MAESELQRRLREAARDGAANAGFPGIGKLIDWQLRELADDAEWQAYVERLCFPEDEKK